LVPSTRGEQHAAFSPDGRRVAFCSWRSGDGRIWICNVDGSACHELALPGGSDYACSPSWSPDGRRLTFDARSDAGFHVYIAAPDGGTIRPLTSAATSDDRPRWSRDGRWIYHSSTRSGDLQIWKTPADGPDANPAGVRITPHGGIEADESPDGRYLYYAKRDAPGVFRLPMVGPGAGAEERILDIGGEGRWCLGSHGIYVLDDRSGPAPAIRLYDPDTRRTHEVRELPPEWSFVQYGGALTVSPDGHWAVVTRERIVESDITLVEGFR
jgi:Tol biopolymer transport system component